MSRTLIEPPPLDAHIQSLLQMAVAEDMVGPGHGAPGDKTVELAIPDSLNVSAAIIARAPGTLAGAFLLAPILALYPSNNPPQLTLLTPDASKLIPNQPIASLQGSARTLLSAERTLLNFLGHLSGIATLTAQYVDAIADIHSTPHGKPPQIVDTRKTTPAFRTLDKYAVRCGGGHNHRLGLYDGVMLKDNHLLALKQKLGPGGGDLTLAQLTRQLRQQLDQAGGGITLWLEVDNMQQLAQALPNGGADIILLDNFTTPQMRQAVELRNFQHSASSIQHSPLLEASGGITLDNLREVAATGIDRIAIGALTHSAKVLDLSMEFH